MTVPVAGSTPPMKLIARSANSTGPAASPGTRHAPLIFCIARALQERNRRAIALVQPAGLHHQGDVPERADILQRVFSHGDDIGELALLQRTGLLIQPEELSRAHGR